MIHNPVSDCIIILQELRLAQFSAIFSVQFEEPVSHSCRIHLAVWGSIWDIVLYFMGSETRVPAISPYLSLKRSLILLLTTQHVFYTML